MVSTPYAEQAVLFDCAGQALIGIVTTPPNGSTTEGTTGVLVIVGGPQYRIGSHRQFVLLARRLAAQGIPVMRFDYRGMGDSDGPMLSFDDVVQDTQAAIAAFVRACPGVERIALWGLCDAASASLLYWDATRDPRIVGMVLADPWISSEEAFAQSQVKHYLKRPFQRAFWTKVFGGGIDFAGAMRDLVAVARKAVKRGGGDDPPVARPFQARMTDGMKSFPGPVLLVLSGDLTARDFVQYCETHPEWQALISTRRVERGEVPGATHTFSTAAARARVESMTIDWLKRSVL